MFRVRFFKVGEGSPSAESFGLVGVYEGSLDSSCPYSEWGA